MRATTFAVVLLCSCHRGDDVAGPDGGGADAELPSGAVCPTGANTTSLGAQVTLDIDLGQGPLQQQFTGAAVQQPALLPVSDAIYGINNYPENNYFLNYPKTQFGLMRWGGDSYSAWNWTTNATNGGADNGFENTNQFMPFSYGSDPQDPAYHGNPHDTNMGGAMIDGSDSVPAAQARGAASLVTISVQDYVAATADDQAVTYAPSADFVANGAAHASGGASVYQDDYVEFLATYSQAPIYYELDNEPNYWKGTHPEVFGTQDLSFDELVSRDVEFATAIKQAAANAVVFGPVVAGIDGMTSLDDYTNLAATNPYATMNIDAISYYLAHVATASSQAGLRLLDVLDLHYYNDSKDKAGTAKTDAECAQGPRDYWDPAYSTVDTSFDDYITGWKPRVLIPRMEASIAANYADTKLAFTEYNNGCEQSIGGGVAEADTLGVFGQYGVFAATAWPLHSAAPGGNWLVGAFDAYRSYDGDGATVGSLAASSISSDVTSVSVYGFVAPNGATGAQVVAINRTDAMVTVEVRLSNACALTLAQPYQLTAASAAFTSAGPPIAITANAFEYPLPAMSVTTFSLTP